MLYLLKLLLYCFCLTTLNVKSLRADASFEDADQVNEFITMSFSSSHPYDLRQTIPGEPEVDYPIYSAVPQTNFDCRDRHEGYYADTEARCQVFRICTNTDLVGKGFAFLCPNGTLFSQKNFVCDWYRNVDCSESEIFYTKNDDNRIGSKTDIMRTVRQMMEHPMKTISIALNRGKSSKQQTPLPNSHLATSTPNTQKKVSKDFQTVTTPSSRLQIQDNFNLEDQSIALKEGKITSRALESLHETQTTEQTKSKTSHSEDEVDPLNVAPLSVRTPLQTFSPPFEAPLLPPYESPLSNESASFETPSFTTQFESQASPIDQNTNEQEVYISSLGELSTDPGANFNRQTSRIISDSPSNELETEPKPFNFANKVNAGLSGHEILNDDGIIAPEYVKNIMEQNVAGPDGIIQPVPFDFASNINSLLDEVTYEAGSEGSHSTQIQQQAPLKEAATSTKKPFRFLSRGFSHENLNADGSYGYGPTLASRTKSRTTQHTTAAKSLGNSLTTTLLTTTQTSVTSTDINQILTLEKASENSKLQYSDELNIKLEAQNDILDHSDAFEIQENGSPNFMDSDLKPTLLSKPAVKREQKELNNLDALGLVKDSSPELDSKSRSESSINTEEQNSSQNINNEEKDDANKKAEDLLLAGVKQITVSNPSEKGKNGEDDKSIPIVPIYNRVLEPQPSTTSPASSIPTSTFSISVPISTNDVTNSISSTTFETSSEPSTTPAVVIRRFTVGSANRRFNSYPRRNKLPRSGQRTTLPTTTTATTPNHRGRSNLRSTSTTPASSTIRTTSSLRKRLNNNRYNFGSRRRTTESTVSVSSTTTAAPTKKLNVQNSDSAVSDLTAVATTYNVAPNREYNSIRQNSLKYSQTKRRRPAHKKNALETTTTSTTTTSKPSPKSSTTQQTITSPLYPIPTLTPFSPHDALSSMPIQLTTPEPLPATFLSFNDLTKSITDDSILQTLRKNQDVNKQLIDSKAFRNQQQQGLPRQQLSFLSAPRSQQDSSSQSSPFSEATSLPFIPLKDFIASKFGPQYSPAPPKLSTPRPSPVTPGIKNDFTLKTQTINPVPDQQYNQQQYGNIHQEFVSQTNLATKIPSAAMNQNVFQHQQQSQLNVNQQLQQQYQEQLVKFQQQQQRLQQLKQQQNHLQHQYQLQQQQKLQHQQLFQQQQQQHHQQQLPSQQYFSSNQRQIFPTQQYTQIQQISQQQQQQQVPTKIIPSLEQQFQIQQSIPLPSQQQRQQSQIQIIPSQMTMSQTIRPQQSNSNFKSEIGSINVRLPSNLPGLIPNTNIFGSAQRRSDHAFDDIYGLGRGRKSVFSGVSSYDVPLSSVGRLTNDITYLLRQTRL